jgi:hypothetical protein
MSGHSSNLFHLFPVSEAQLLQPTFRNEPSPAVAAPAWLNPPLLRAFAGLFQLPSPTTRNPPRIQRSRPQETSAKQRVPGWTGVSHLEKHDEKHGRSNLAYVGIINFLESQIK